MAFASVAGDDALPLKALRGVIARWLGE